MKVKSIALLTLLTVFLAGCHKSGDQANGGSGSNGGGKEITVSAFQGGYDIDFYQAAAKDYEKSHPGVTVKVEGDPRIWEKLQPLFVAGTPPDLTLPGWGMDHWGLVEEGQLRDLTADMDTMAADGKTKWKDTFDPLLLKMGQKDGKQYVLPYYFNVMGWWYDPDLFAKNGWKVPQTWDQLLTLCDQIKAKGIAPITFQGKYPYYMIEGMVYPWIQSIGGIQAINDIQNLVPGAWKAPAVLQTAQMIKQLNDKGFFETGAVGLSHTEAQSDFINDKAAMIPCGTWLYAEEKKNMKGAKISMEFMLPPVVAGGKGDPSALLIGIEPWMVPSKAKNQEGAIDFFKYMTSLDEAKKFVTDKGTLMAIKGSDDVKLPSVLVTPDKFYKASKLIYANQLRYWYAKMETDIESALTSLLNNEITPDQFCDKCEAAAEATRNDKDIAKHKIEG